MLKALICLLTASTPVWGREPKADMTRMPRTGEMKPYRAPARGRFKLANGIEVVFIEDRRRPLVTARLSFKGGEALTALKTPGLARAMGDLLTEGTGKKTALEIAEAADAYGGAIGARTGREYTVLTAYALSEKSGEMFSLLSEVAASPSFPEREVALRKENMLEELKLARSQPDFLAAVAFNKALYGGHPYGVVATDEAAISAVNREALIALHRRLLVPGRCRAVVVGDISAASLRELLEKSLGAWRPEAGEDVFAADYVEPEPGKKRATALYDRPGAEQATLILGDIAVREDSPDYFPLLLANQILGGSFAARLSADIREKRGYTYGIYSSLSTFARAGTFSVRTQTRTEVLDKTVAAVLEHLRDLREHPVKYEELEQAKNMLVGDFARELETQGGLAEAVLDGLHRGLPEEHLDTYVPSVNEVTVAGVQRAAKTYLRPDSVTIAVAGDAKALKDALSAFGPVALVDHDGRPK